MNKFSFELQDVLEFRKFEEEQAERELSKALFRESEIKNALEQLAQEYVRTSALQNQSSSFWDIAAGYNYKELLMKKKEELLNQLTQAKLVTEEKREALGKIMKKTGALEKLKEKQLSLYKEEIEKEEAEELDEYSLARQNL